MKNGSNGYEYVSILKSDYKSLPNEGKKQVQHFIEFKRNELNKEINEFIQFLKHQYNIK